MTRGCSYDKSLSFRDKEINIDPDTISRQISFATKAAQKADTRYKVGCLLITNDCTYDGWSMYKTHPLQKEYNTNKNKLFLHAEMHALTKALKGQSSLNRAVVARVLKDGSYADSSPCDACMLALVEAGIKEIVYYRTDVWRLVTINERS